MPEHEESVELATIAGEDVPGTKEAFVDGRAFPLTVQELRAFIREEVRKALADELRASSVFAGMPVI